MRLLLFAEVGHKKTIQKPFTMQLTLNLKCLNKLETASQKNQKPKLTVMHLY